MNRCKTITFLATILYAIGCGEAPSPPLVAKEVSNIVDAAERYSQMMIDHPDLLCANESNISWLVKNECKEAGELLNSYYEATTGQWRRAGAIRLAVVGEDGAIIEGVKATLRGVSEGIVPSLEPTVRSSTKSFAGEIVIPWPASSFAIELELSKDGYRRTRTSFDEVDTRFNDHLYRVAHTDLNEGVKLPPAVSGGPVRVLMRRRLVWDPPVEDQGWIAMSPDRKSWPKTITPESQVLSSTDDPRVIQSPEHATYLIADKDGKVEEVVRAYKGQVLGFVRYKYLEASQKSVRFEHSSHYLHWTGANDGEPYRLYMYRKAVIMN